MTLAHAVRRGARVVAGTARTVCDVPRRAVVQWRLPPDATAVPGGGFEPVTLVAQEIPSHDGGTINFVDSGPGTAAVTFVLAHGVSLSLRTWVHQLRDLPAAGFRTIAFDHRGHGASTLGATEFSVDNLGDDIATLIETLDLHDVVLVGHSMGGIAVQSFLARHEDLAARRLRGLVLLSSVAANQHGSQAAQLNLLAERVLRRKADSTWLWSNRVLGALVAGVGFGDDPDPRQLEYVRQMLRECAPHTRVHGPRSLIGFDLSAELERIHVPTLVVVGTADVITPVGISQRMHRQLRDSRLEVVHGGGHMLMLERPEHIEAVLCSFAHEVGTGIGAEAQGAP
jgi:pimeloyl-ACP methyl ester carboxylesterase